MELEKVAMSDDYFIKRGTTYHRTDDKHFWTTDVQIIYSLIYINRHLFKGCICIHRSKICLVAKISLLSEATLMARMTFAGTLPKCGFLLR